MKNHRLHAIRWLTEVYSRDEEGKKIIEELRPLSSREFKAKAEEKYKLIWVEEYKKKVEDEIYTTERCEAARAHAGMSDRAYDRNRDMMKGDWDGETNEHVVQTVEVVPGQPRVGAPVGVCSKTLSRSRKRYCEELVVKLLEGTV